jgi:hypothetical protein
MGFWGYWWAVFKTACRHSFGGTQNVLFGAFILLGVAAKAFPPLAPMTQALSTVEVAVMVMASIVGVRLVLSPYWMHQEQRRTIRALHQGAPISDLHAYLVEPHVTISECLLQVFCVEVRNTGIGPLANCQAWVSILQEDTGGGLGEYPASSPFRLRNGEMRCLPLFTTDHDDGGAPAHPVSFFDFQGDWRELKNNPKLPPMGYRVTLRIVSDSTPTRSLPLRLSHDGRDWSLRLT